MLFSFDLLKVLLMWITLCFMIKKISNIRINEISSKPNVKHNEKLPISCLNNSKLNGCNKLNVNQDFIHHQFDTQPVAFNPKDNLLLTNKLILTSSGYISEGLNYKFTPLELTEKKYLDKYPHSINFSSNNTKLDNLNKNLNSKTSFHSISNDNLISNQNTTDYSVKNQSYPPFNNSISLLKINEKLFNDIYNTENSLEMNKMSENVHQINQWLEENNPNIDNLTMGKMLEASLNIYNSRLNNSKFIDHNLNIAETKQNNDYLDYDDSPDQSVSSMNDDKKNEKKFSNKETLSGTSKTPPCASSGRFYCSYKEDYPHKVINEMTKYYKWPLEKLFRDLRQQVMPKLANDNYGALVCDSITRVIRPGWAKNTANKWLVIINNDVYQQYITEIICRHGTEAQCNFISPCYQATCKQRFNTQKLLVIDPWNPYKGPFLSEFLFASCCVCYIPEYPLNNHVLTSNLKSTFIKNEN